MPFYSTPDVYIEEVPSGARPIEPVGTSTAGFVGVAPYAKAHRPDMSKLPDAVAINNWTEFVREFCIAPGADPNDLDARFSSTWLSQAVYGFFLNGGSRCYVVNVGVMPEAAKSGAKKGDPAANADQGTDERRGLVSEGLTVLEQYDEVAIVLAPGYTTAADYDAVLTHCENLKDRVAVLDAPSMDTKPDDLTQNGAMPRASLLGFGAFYYPWIQVRDPLSRSGALVAVPPSGHMAGIWARTDATRGVHKAPANETVRGAVRPDLPLDAAGTRRAQPARRQLHPLLRPRGDSGLGRAHARRIRQRVALPERAPPVQHDREDRLPRTPAGSCLSRTTSRSGSRSGAT